MAEITHSDAIEAIEAGDIAKAIEITLDILRQSLYVSDLRKRTQRTSFMLKPIPMILKQMP
ncbi:MAG: hypothetical protein MZV63_46545 [Marinilabiliales bacterium]|nr:hypothetical protein [Marinilabiliales bacterium]